MKQDLPIEASYKKAAKLIADFGRKHEIRDVDIDLLKGEMNLVLVELHNAVVGNMKEDLLPEINKLYERYGYKK